MTEQEKQEYSPFVKWAGYIFTGILLACFAFFAIALAIRGVQWVFSL